MIAKIAVEGIELFARCGTHGTGDAQIVVLLAGAQFHRCRIEIGGVPLHDLDNSLHQPRLAPSHDLDREGGGVLDEGGVLHQVIQTIEPRSAREKHSPRRTRRKKETRKRQSGLKGR